MPALSMGYDGLNRMITSNADERGATDGLRLRAGRAAGGAERCRDPEISPAAEQPVDFLRVWPGRAAHRGLRGDLLRAESAVAAVELALYVHVLDGGTCTSGGSWCGRRTCRCCRTGSGSLRAARRWDGPAGVGALPRVHGRGVLTTRTGRRRRRRANDTQKFADLHAGFGDGAGLRAEPVLCDARLGGLRRRTRRWTT